MLRRCEALCIQRDLDPFLSSVNNVLEFLNELHSSVCQYSARCTAPSVLASVVTIQVFSSLSDHPIIHHYLKGIYNRNPPMPKYIQVWNLKLILNFYDKAPPNNELSFKQLTLKVAMLIMILGAHRKQSVMSIDIINYQSDENKAILLPNTLLKHSRPASPIEPLIYHRFNKNTKLCVVSCLDEYTKQRNTRVPLDTGSLLITFGKPYRKPSDKTFARRIETEFVNAGIDI